MGEQYDPLVTNEPCLGSENYRNGQSRESHSWKSMGPFVVSAWKFGAIEPRRRLDCKSARRLQSVKFGSYGAGRSSPVEPILCVQGQEELFPGLDNKDEWWF